MKLLYITGLNIKYYMPYGILRKIFGQVGAFKKFGYDVDISFLVGNDYILYNTNNENFHSSKDLRSSSLLNVLKGRSALCHLAKKIVLKKYDVVYIRFVALNVNTLLFLKHIRKQTRFIILEIPTYPYKTENYSKINENNFLVFLNYIKFILVDFSIKILLKRFIDFIVLTIPKKFLWGIPVVSIENGIDCQKFESRNKSEAKNKIVLVTATNIEKWQGLDRLILGLSDYRRHGQNSKEVIIKIAGEGSEKNRLEKLAHKMGLEEIIHFIGQISGKRLDEFYDEGDIGIGSLGRHRQRTNIVSTLKIKEYCAKGIPFIYSNDEPALTGREAFALKVPADDSPVDFNKVIDFNERIQNTPTVIQEMKDLAKSKFDWVHQIGLIHNKIQTLNP